MKTGSEVQRLLAEHKAKFDAMLDDLEHTLETLIVARVEARVRPAMAALSGDMSALMPRPKAHKVVPKAAGRAVAAKPTSPTDPARVRFVNAVIKLRPAERAAYAKENGISKFKMYKWLREAGIKRETNGSKTGRRVYTREYKVAVVAKAGAMAPGDRETYLAEQNLNPNMIYKWRKELKAPKAAA